MKTGHKSVTREHQRGKREINIMAGIFSSIDDDDGSGGGDASIFPVSPF